MDEIFNRAQLPVSARATAGLAVTFSRARICPIVRVASVRVWFCRTFAARWGDTENYIDKTFSGPWRPGDALDTFFSLPFRAAVPADLDWSVVWQRSYGRDTFRQAVWSRAATRDQARLLPWGRSSLADAYPQLFWKRSTAADFFPDISWARSQSADFFNRLFWSRSEAVDISPVISWGRSCAADILPVLPWSRSRQADFTPVTWYERGVGNIRTFEVVDPVELRWLASRGTIMITQDTSLKRVSDDTPIKIESFSLRTDRNSWGWNFSAAISNRDNLALLRPVGGPVEVELIVNGYIWRLMIEDALENHSFGDAGYSVSGRSSACILAAPYVPPQTKQFSAQINAQQIAAGELTDTGWNLNWQISDWTIPAGVFSVSNQDKMQIINRVARASGAMVRDLGGSTVADGWANTLSIVPAYKQVPHHFADADPDEYVLAGVILSEDVSWDPKSGYDYIFVCGETSDGVIVRLSWDGTKTNPAPDVTDSLLCETLPAKDRGIYELCRESFNQTKYSLSLPLPASDSGMRPKLLLPGDIVSITDSYETFYGIVDGVSLAGADGVGVVQRAEIERHHLS